LDKTLTPSAQSTRSDSPATREVAETGGIVVSIVIPCRNERQFIGMCLDSILANEYPMSSLQVLVVDGMSEDGTREIVTHYSQLHPFIRLIDNPRRITPCALNIGITEAHGEIVMRMDAHATYSPQYIVLCVDALQRYGADDVGGVWRIIPQENTLLGNGIARLMSHPFGAGNARYRYINPTVPESVDVVPYFCCRRETLDRVGPFNERLTRNQDMDFNNRLRKSGGTILLVPGVVSYYHSRSSLFLFVRRYFVDGAWGVMGFAYADQLPLSPRHLVPLAFVLAVLTTALAGLVVPAARWLLLLAVGSYALVDLAASLDIAWKNRDARYALVMPWVFLAFHVGHGLGSLWGIIRLAAMPEFWRKLARQPST
jgi:glycosyltransferase involved in cell wall biosynthesis